jgi:hypothetical protein
MNYLKARSHLNIPIVVLTAVALLCGSVGVAKLQKSVTSVLFHSAPAVVQVADGVAPSPPPPPPPPSGMVPASQA